MPQVSKQGTSAPRSQVLSAQSQGSDGGSVLGRIRPVKASGLGHFKFSVYGNPKTGKTRFACTFPKPLLLVGFEDGSASVAGVRGVDFVLLDSTSEFDELVEGPIKAGRYKTVVADNLSKMREMRIAELFDSMGVAVPERKPFLYADQLWKQVWNQAAADLKKSLSPLLDLPNRREMNVVAIAQEQVFAGPDENPSAVALGEAIKPSVGSALGKMLSMWLNAECDYIAQTFIRQQVRVVKQDFGGEEMEQTVSTGKKEFCLRVGPHETYVTGFRQPERAPELPECVVDPHYDKIVKLVTPIK